MKAIWRKHLITCLVLGVLAIPIYFLDGALLGPKAGGGNWVTGDLRGLIFWTYITLDFRGLIFWTYITLLAIHVPLSSLGVLLFPTAGALWIHLGSMVLAVVLFITGV